MAKLLLLDDEEDALTWMTAALETRGHEVKSFLSGRAALDGLATFTPDLIVADILMPEMDGLAFARLVREHRDVPLMFVSIAKKEAEAVIAGAVGYVQKPATAAELRAAVDHVLGERKEKRVLLIVDDDPEVRDLYRSVLEKPDSIVLSAEDGREALDVLRAQPVDLAIVDVHMPVMNGAELIRAMRADPALERVPVVVQTSDRAALEAPVWGSLHVARLLEKDKFVDWCEGRMG